MNSRITEVWQVRVKAQTYTQATLAAMIELKWNLPVLHIPLRCCLSFFAFHDSVISPSRKCKFETGPSRWASQWTGWCVDCCWIINPIRCESDTNEWFIFRGWWLLPDPPAVSSGVPSARKPLVSSTNISKAVHTSPLLCQISRFLHWMLSTSSATVSSNLTAFWCCIL